MFRSYQSIEFESVKHYVGNPPKDVLDLISKVTLENVKDNPILVDNNITEVISLISLFGPYFVYNVPLTPLIVSTCIYKC